MTKLEAAKEQQQRVVLALYGLYEAVRAYLPVGSRVQVKRGKGLWEVEVMSHHKGKDSGEFVGKTRTGNYHHFNFNNVTAIL